MTTIAKAIEVLARKDVWEAIEMAEIRAVAKDQLWEVEQTKYIFDDNSVLVIEGALFWAKEGVNI